MYHHTCNHEADHNYYYTYDHYYNYYNYNNYNNDHYNNCGTDYYIDYCCVLFC